ncbi:MAG: 1,4-dihydroxy-2-naphthoate polyprenyltransferase, partial [Candidatus Dormibacteria bacterium]
GERPARLLLVFSLALAIALPAIAEALGVLPRLAAFSALAMVLAVQPLQVALRARGRELVAALAGISRFNLVYGAALAALLLAA